MKKTIIINAWQKIRQQFLGTDQNKIDFLLLVFVLYSNLEQVWIAWSVEANFALKCGHHSSLFYDILTKKLVINKSIK